MPVSIHVHVSQCVGRIIGLNPQSVLDIGLGFGLWGFLCREYLDVFSGRIAPDLWQVRIDGVEYFEPYIQAHQRAIYSSIRIGDIRNIAPTLDQYDLIIAGDVIEHLEKDVAEDVLETLWEKADKALMVNIPLGEGWDHPEQYGNPAELHRSSWFPEDFAPFPYHGDIYDTPCGQYGTFFCRKECTAEQRLQGILDAAVFYEQRGDTARALKHYRHGFMLAPHEPVIAMGLTSLLIERKELLDAVQVLEQAIGANPGFCEGRLYAARLWLTLGDRSAARECLSALADSEDASDEIRHEALALLSGIRIT